MDGSGTYDRLEAKLEPAIADQIARDAGVAELRSFVDRVWIEIV